MKTPLENRQKLVTELIERSAKIDLLVVISRQSSSDVTLNYNQDLEELRARQRETTKKLHASEEPCSNAWENIGDGG